MISRAWGRRGSTPTKVTSRRRREAIAAIPSFFSSIEVIVLSPRANPKSIVMITARSTPASSMEASNFDPSGSHTPGHTCSSKYSGRPAASA